jgi:hypothetical protein
VIVGALGFNNVSSANSQVVSVVGTAPIKIMQVKIQDNLSSHQNNEAEVDA